MPTHVYQCEFRHETTLTQSIRMPVPKHIPCAHCRSDDGPVRADWRPPTGTMFSINDGGTGAQKKERR